MQQQNHGPPAERLDVQSKQLVNHGQGFRAQNPLLHVSPQAMSGYVARAPDSILGEAAADDVHWSGVAVTVLRTYWRHFILRGVYY